MAHRCQILMTEFVTHNVRRFILERPRGYDFEPGTATDVSIADDPGFEGEERPFTFTSLPRHRVLELTIKAYPEHEGVTQRIHGLEAGDALMLGDPWGTIHYRGDGVFIAGGTGITPFIAILRNLAAEGKMGENQLIFANRTAADIVLEKELRHVLRDRLTLVLDEGAEAPGHVTGRVDAAFLKERVKDFSRPFYLCGPPGMVDSIKGTLQELGASPDALVFEQ